jgi:hypothetical protein
MEDTLTYAPGQPTTGNYELVQRAATLANMALRPPLTTDEARTMLGVVDRRALVASSAGSAEDAS